MKKPPEPLLWLDEHRGKYIPRDFARCWKNRDEHVSGVSAWQWAQIDADEPGEFYWDAWGEILDNARVQIDGERYHLYQDGDLWLIPVAWEWSDDVGFFVPPCEHRITGGELVCADCGAAFHDPLRT